MNELFNRLASRLHLRVLALEDGQTMAEYGVVLAVITIGAIAAFTALSGGISNALNNITSLLP